MKITVKHSGKNIRLRIPTAMIFGKIPVKLWLKLGNATRKSWSPYLPEDTGTHLTLLPWDLPEAAAVAFCGELMRIKRLYGSWKLVELQSADGDEVLIEL